MCPFKQTNISLEDSLTDLEEDQEGSFQEDQVGSLEDQEATFQGQEGSHDDREDSKGDNKTESHLWDKVSMYLTVLFSINKWNDVFF